MSLDGPWPDFKGGTSYKIVNLLQDVHPSVLGDLSSYFTMNPFPIPLDQVTGYTAQTPYQATPIAAEETTTSTSYTDLTTVGPILQNLPDGLYTITWGASAKISAATTRARMGVSINNGVVDNTLQAYTQSTQNAGISFSCSLRLSAGTGGNTIVCKYAVGVGGTGTALYGSRYLLAIKQSGP